MSLASRDFVKRVRGIPGFKFPSNFIDYVPRPEFVKFLEFLEFAECIHDIPDIEEFSTAEGYLAVEAELQSEIIRHPESNSFIEPQVECIDCNSYDISYDIKVHWYIILTGNRSPCADHCPDICCNQTKYPVVDLRTSARSTTPDPSELTALNISSLF